MRIVTLFFFVGCIALSIDLLGQKLDFIYVFGCTEYGSSASTVNAFSNGNILLSGSFQGTMDVDPTTTVKSVTSYPGARTLFNVTIGQDGSIISAGPVNTTKSQAILYNDLDKYGNFYNCTLTSENGTAGFRKNAGANSWTYTFTSEKYNTFMSFTKVLADSKNNTYILTKISQTVISSAKDTFKLSGDKNIYLIKFDSKGKVIQKLDLTPGSGGSDDVTIYDAEINNRDEIICVGGFVGQSRLRFTNVDTLLKTTGTQTGVMFSINSDFELLNMKTLISNQAIKHQYVAVELDSLQNIYYATAANANVPNLIEKISPDWQLIWSKQLGSRPHTHKMSVMPNGSFYFMSKYYVSTDMDPNPNGIYTSRTDYAQQYGHYLAKYDKDGNVIWGKRIYAYAEAVCEIMEVDKYENVYIAGTILPEMELDNPAGGKIKIKALDDHLQSAYIIKFKKEQCSDSEVQDYFIPKFYNDLGDHALASDFKPWECSGLYTTGNATDFQNEIYCQVKSKMCSTDTTEAKLELYYAFPYFSDLSWPDAYTKKTVTVEGKEYVLSNLAASIPIPRLMSNDIWTAYSKVSDYPKPMNFNQNSFTINFIGRIVSTADKDVVAPSNVVLHNVVNNNNWAWKIFNVK